MVWSQAYQWITLSVYSSRTHRILGASRLLSLHVFLLANLPPASHHRHLDLLQPRKNQHSPQLFDEEKVQSAVFFQVPVFVIVQTYLLFPLLLPLVLCVLQHLLSPQVKEVGRIGVKLQTLLPIVPADGQKKPISRYKTANQEKWSAHQLIMELLLAAGYHTHLLFSFVYFPLKKSTRLLHLIKQ